MDKVSCLIDSLTESSFSSAIYTNKMNTSKKLLMHCKVFLFKTVTFEIAFREFWFLQLSVSVKMIPGLVRGSVILSISFVGFFGNLSIFVVVAAKRSFHVMHFFLLANLSLSDLLFNFTITFYAFSMMSEKWIFGLAWCKGSYFLLITLTNATILLLCAITWECHTAVVTPFQFSSEITVKKVAAVVLLWIISFLFTGGSHFGSSKLVYNDYYYFCSYELPSGILITVIILIFIVPLGFIAKHQYQIYRVAKRQKTRIAQQHAINFNRPEGEQQRNFIKEVKESKDALIIVASFLLSYLPFFIIASLRRKFPESDALYNAWFFGVALLGAGSTANPIIYCLRKRKLRRECLQFFCRKSSDRVFPQVSPHQ